MVVREAVKVDGFVKLANVDVWTANAVRASDCVVLNRSHS